MHVCVCVRVCCVCVHGCVLCVGVCACVWVCTRVCVYMCECQNYMYPLLHKSEHVYWWCRRGSLLLCWYRANWIAYRKVLYAVDKGLRDRNVLHQLLLILLCICSRSVRPMYIDAVEAHTCVDIVAIFTDEQYTTINQLSTAGRFDLRVFVNCLQVS